MVHRHALSSCRGKCDHQNIPIWRTGKEVPPQTLGNEKQLQRTEPPTTSKHRVKMQTYA